MRWTSLWLNMKLLIIILSYLNSLRHLDSSSSKRGWLIGAKRSVSFLNKHLHNQGTLFNLFTPVKTSVWFCCSVNISHMWESNSSFSLPLPPLPLSPPPLQNGTEIEVLVERAQPWWHLSKKNKSMFHITTWGPTETLHYVLIHIVEGDWFFFICFSFFQRKQMKT